MVITLNFTDEEFLSFGLLDTLRRMIPLSAYFADKLTLRNDGCYLIFILIFGLFLEEVISIHSIGVMTTLFIGMALMGPPMAP